MGNITARKIACGIGQLALAPLLLLAAAPTQAITITYVNTGVTDSRVFVGFDNMAGSNTTSDFVSNPSAFSRNDTLFFPSVASSNTMAYSGAELGTNLNSTLGTGLRSVFAPFNPTFFRAHGEINAGGVGPYSAHAFAHSGDTTSTTPTRWIVHVDPSGAETPGTLADVTVTGSISGYVEILSGSAVADAFWNVATTSNGTVMTGSANQSVAGNTPFSDSGSITFQVPLGGTFELLVDYDLSTTGSGPSTDSTSEIAASLVQVSAVIAPPIFVAVNGAKLLMIDKYALSTKAKMVLLLKDTTPGSIAKGPAANPPELSGTVEIFPLSDPTNRAVYTLDTVGWFKNKTQVAKFKNSAAAPGTAGARAVTVKPDKLIKVVAKNLGDGDAATGDQDANDIDLAALTTSDSLIVSVMLENASDNSSYWMCAQFDALQVKQIGGGAGTKVLSKTSSTPTTCPQ